MNKLTTYYGSFIEGKATVMCFNSRKREWYTLTPKRAQAVQPWASRFEWGYRGAGPHTLALALLLHCLPTEEQGDAAAILLYQAFASRWVYNWPIGGHWTITSVDIEEWAATELAHRTAEIEQVSTALARTQPDAVITEVAP